MRHFFVFQTGKTIRSEPQSSFILVLNTVITVFITSTVKDVILRLNLTKLLFFFFFGRPLNYGFHFSLERKCHSFFFCFLFFVFCFFVYSLFPTQVAWMLSEIESFGKLWFAPEILTRRHSCLNSLIYGVINKQCRHSYASYIVFLSRILYYSSSSVSLSNYRKGHWVNT